MKERRGFHFVLCNFPPTKSFRKEIILQAISHDLPEHFGKSHVNSTNKRGVIRPKIEELVKS